MPKRRRTVPDTPDSLLSKLRILDSQMNQAVPSVIEIREFRDLFNELDAMLRTGARFPHDWVTRANQIQLPTEQISAGLSTTDPEDDSPNAWCGHTRLKGSPYCVRPSCANYIYTPHNRK